MSTNHNETEMQKPINEYAKYIKNLIPANIPESYTLKPMFESIGSEADIRNGVIAFRDFLYLFCDRLISDGHLYAKPRKTKNPDDYPFLNNINRFLIEIGCHGKLNESGISLSKPKQRECIRFLSLCGFEFNGTEVQYPKNPIMLIGLKALSIASKELQVRFVNNAHNLLRCDYRVIKAEETDMTDVLKDFLHPLPENLQKFALDLHHRYTDMGMTCAKLDDNAVHIFYSYTKNSKRTLSIRDMYQRRVWQFYLSMKHGYCIFVRAKKTDKYADAIKKFPLALQEKITKGYGCDRKLRNERCQGGCQGIRIPLDESIIDMRRDIEVWLDNEMPRVK